MTELERKVERILAEYSAELQSDAATRRLRSILRRELAPGFGTREEREREGGADWRTA